MTADLYNICRYCPLLVGWLNCEDLSQLYEMSRQVTMFNIMLRLVIATLFHFHRLKLSCRSTFMRSITSSSSFITSAASPAARPATRQWSPSVSPRETCARTNVVDILHLWILVRCSGLLLDAFAEGWEDAVSRASAARGRCSACWVPGSGRQEGTVMFLNECNQKPRLRWPQQIKGQN